MHLRIGHPYPQRHPRRTAHISPAYEQIQRGFRATSSLREPLHPRPAVLLQAGHEPVDGDAVRGPDNACGSVGDCATVSLSDLESIGFRPQRGGQFGCLLVQPAGVIGPRTGRRRRWWGRLGTGLQFQEAVQASCLRSEIRVRGRFREWEALNDESRNVRSSAGSRRAAQAAELREHRIGLLRRQVTAQLYQRLERIALLRRAPRIEAAVQPVRRDELPDPVAARMRS